MNQSDADSPKTAPPTGMLDRLIRRFGRAAHFLLVLLVYLIIAGAIGLALAPALWMLAAWLPWSLTFYGWARWPVAGFGFGLAFLIAGFALLIVVPLLNLILPTRIRSYRGAYYSIAAVPWFLHNALFYLVRYTFLLYVTLTPFGPWFLRAMGMRLGKRVFINTELISDPQLITLGDDVVIGGSVTLFAHWGGGGHLAIEPVMIEAGATIGEKATVMGDVHVGRGAVVLPHSVLLPGARVGAGEIWGGVPARRIMPEEMAALGLHQHHKPSGFRPL